jgi:hypothetical protein
MSAGLMVLHSLLGDLQGNPVEPREIRNLKKYEKDDGKGNVTVEFKALHSFFEKVSKQSITNAAARLEEAHIIDRKENKYTVNYGYLISVLLNTILEMTGRIDDLEDEIDALKKVEP